MFLDEKNKIWNSPDPECVKKFRSQYKDLLGKFIQIGILNSTADDLSKGALKFFKPEEAPSMDMLDTLLSQKVNNDVLKKLIENVSPALNVSLKDTIEGEVKKILYAINHQENLTAALLQLFYAKENPEVLASKVTLENLLNELKDDPEVSRIAKNRPTNDLMLRGANSPDLVKKVENLVKSLAYEDPIEALKAFLEAISLTQFDVSQGDPNKKAHIEASLRKNLGDLENPIEDAMKYSLTLLMAHNSLNDASQLSTKESLESCIKLLGSTKDASYEVNEILRSLEDDNLLTSLQKNEASKVLGSYLDRTCDVESLITLKNEMKGLDTYSNIKSVLGYIDSYLSHTSNTRRKNMTIKEFLNKDSNIDLNFLSRTADTILKEKTKDVADRMTYFEETDIVLNSSDLISDETKSMIKKHLVNEKARKIDFQTLQPFLKTKDSDNQIDELLLNKLSKTLKMSDDLEFTRARIENDLLKAFTYNRPEDKETINDLINRWVDIRVIDLKSKPNFNKLYNSELKHELIKNFKNQISNELGLTNLNRNVLSFEELEPYDLKAMGFQNDIANSVMREDKDYFDDTIKLNSNKDEQHLIVQNSIGYENLAARLQSPEKSYDLTHKNLAEKLLAEYYIDKRRDYRVSKDMLEALDNEFHASKYRDQTKRIGEDLRGAKISMPTSHHQGLSAWDALSNITRDDISLRGEDEMKLIELGNATHLAINGPSHGVAESIAKYSVSDPQWPDRLPKFDVRRDPKEWVEEKLTSVLNSLFSARERIEQNLPAKDSYYGETNSVSSER